MGIETAVAAMSIGSVVSSAYSMNQQKQQLKEQKRQYNETKAEAEKTKQEEINKQKKLADTYKNMKTNLFTGDISGVSTDTLIQ